MHMIHRHIYIYILHTHTIYTHTHVFHLRAVSAGKSKARTESCFDSLPAFCSNVDQHSPGKGGA